MPNYSWLISVSSAYRLPIRAVWRASPRRANRPFAPAKETTLRDLIFSPATPRYRVWLWRTLFWGALVFAFVMAVLPHPPSVPGTPSDKVQHITAFAALTALSLGAFPRVRWFATLAGLSAFGALIEFVQAIPALHRDAELLDWIADTGAILAILLVRALIAAIARSLKPRA